ncbi:MAG TPA: DUF1570 domain-containing protein [Pirellulales bacterium]|nr:DUF1570 domain-containing protein [Pirellulales bacterium]
MRLWLTIFVAFWPSVAGAADTVKLRRDGRELEVRGQVLVEAQDGGLLVLGRDGLLWAVEPDDLVEHTSDDEPFAPLSAAELGKTLLKELPEGFDLHTTQHYLICYNTSKVYAQWCGALFERLYMSFNNYWGRKKIELRDSQFPLVALVFSDHEAYARFAAGELGEGTRSIIGYYSLQTNRMTMYDLTGVESLRQPGDRRSSASQINLMLSRPEAERAVATVIHEATHQIAFNCGLQARYADIPRWLCEGIAMYFETPDLASSKGWRSIGSVNQVRLAGFRNYLPRRPADSLTTLLAGSDRLRDPKRADDAYGEAWALNYFLIKQRPKQYLQYIKALAAKQPLLSDDPQVKIEEFKQAFGNDLEQLDADFVRHLSKVK